MKFSNFNSPKLLFVFLINFIFTSSTKIDIPFKTKNNNDPSLDVFDEIFNNEIYIQLNVGEPFQSVEFYLTSKTSHFIINQNSSMNYFYDSNKSSTYLNICEITPYINDDVLDRGIPSTEKFVFFLDNNHNITIDNLEFNYATKVKKKINKKHMGILGMQLHSSTYYKDINFINILKKRNIISSYVWNLKYTTDNEGFLTIGEYPHEYEQNNFKEKDLKNTKAINNGGLSKLKFNLHFDSVIYGNNKTKIERFKGGLLMPEMGVIIGTLEYSQLVLNDTFKELIEKSKCQKNSYGKYGKYFYYVCDEDTEIKNFETITFLHEDLEPGNGFKLTKEDLFLKKNGKLYFLVVFEEYTTDYYAWVLGKPFYKKYNLLFDQDAKLILNYNKGVINDDINENTIKIVNYWLWICVAFLVVVIVVLAVIVTQCIKKNRKPKLNEMDENFDYFNGNKEQTKLGINDE